MGGKWLEKKYFDAQVSQVVLAIPHGKVASYGQVASLAGFPRYSRQVSKTLNRRGDSLPWHRVVGSLDKNRFKISARNEAHATLQRERLLKEGVWVEPTFAIKRVDHSWLPQDFVK